MMKRSLVALGMLFCLPGFSLAQRVLIACDPSNPATLDVGFALAEQIEQQFNLTPILWSLTDPVWRMEVQTGNITVPEKPTLAAARKIVGDLRADYTLWVSGERKEGVVYATLEAFKGRSGRSFYKNSTNAMVTGTTGDDAPQSVARFWMLAIGNNEWKGFKKSESGSPEMGVTPLPNTSTGFIVPAPEFGVSSQYFEELEKLKQDGKIDEATVMLYQAVDRAPRNLELRAALVDALLDQGKAEAAQAEINRTLLVFPGQMPLRVQLVKSLISSNSFAAAEDQLAEAITREPENSALWSLDGDLSLMQRRWERGRQSHMKAVQLGGGKEAQLGLAMAMACVGEQTEVERILTEQKESTISLSRLRYIERISQDFSSETAIFISQWLRSIRVGLTPAAGQQFKLELQAILRRAKAQASLVSSLNTSGEMEKLMKQRSLAHHLLIQALTQTELFMDTRNADHAAEAEFNLGDAMLRFEKLAQRQP